MLNHFHTLLTGKREAILAAWGENHQMRELLSRLNLSVEEHRENIAIPVFENLLYMLEATETPNDCPVMRELVEAFYNRGVTVEDVFLNCTGLKNAIITLLFDEATEYEIAPLIELLDTNLYHVLSIYTDKLREHEKELQMHSRIIEEHVVLTITDTEGKIIYVTDAFCKLTGFKKEELLGNNHSIIRHQTMKDGLFKGLWKCIQSGRTWHGKIKNRKKDGGEFIANTEIIPVKDEAGMIIEYMAIRNDITDKELSGLDPLTGLFNRRKLDHLMEKQIGSDDTLSLMLVDLDHFKSINDTFGHQAGDRVLKRFAKLLCEHVRDRDICARWGGEEFVVLLPGTPLDTAHAVAEQIRKATESSSMLDNHPVHCTIGLTEISKEDTVKSLFQRADSFLYRGKQAGRNRIVTSVKD